MKKLSFLLVLVIAGSVMAQQPAASSEGISFEHGTWAEALAKAKKEKKMIMLDAYTSWCGPCKWMVKNVFPQKEVGEFYNKNFVSVKIDMEKGEGIELSKKFGVMAYPTYLFVSADELVLHRSCGSCEGADFIKIGTTALDPKTRLSGLHREFSANSKSAAAASNYFEAAEKACMNIEADVKKYLDNLKPEQFLEEGNYTLINKFVNDYSHASFLFMLNNYEKFTTKFGKKEVDEKIHEVYKNSLNDAARARNPANVIEIQKAYSSQKNTPIDYLDAYSNMLLADIKQDTAVYFPATILFIEKYAMNDGDRLNAVAWDFYERTNNKAYLEKALSFAKKSIELESAYPNNDTYAALLFKLGRFSEAKAAAEKAIEIGSNAKANVAETEDLLKKINEQLMK